MRPEDYNLPRNLRELLASLDRLLGNQPSLRRNLQWYVDAGMIFVELKRRTRHGEFDKLLPAICEPRGIKKRTAKEWMFLASNVRLTASLDLPKEPTCSDFLAAFRAGKREVMHLTRKKKRDEALENAAPEHERFIVHHADCMKFKEWPKDLAMVCTDPPWADLKAYKWLADFSACHLADGGLLLVQFGQEMLDRVLPILANKLTYQNCFAMIFPSVKRAERSQFMNKWRPLLLFSKGKWNARALETKCADGFNVKPATKEDHVWEQPTEPFEQWIRCLTPEGAAIADPFCGTGTSGAATKIAGAGRTWTGTDHNAQNVHLARQKIDAAEERGEK